MESTTTKTNGSIVVHELSRATSFNGTSRLRLRLDGHPEAVWEAVWALFAQAQFYDREIGMIRGRIEEPGSRFRLRANQWMTTRFEERQEDHSMVTFEISVKFIGRAVDGFVFNRIVQMLKDGVKARQNATWFSRLTADTKTPAESIITGNILPLSCAILGCILLDLILVGVGDALYHSREPFLSGVVTSTWANTLTR